MRNQKIEHLVNFLQYEDFAYDIYLEYCKSNDIVVELFGFVDGLNIIFDTPQEAVVTLHDNGIKMGAWDLIYRDKSYKVRVCDFVNECRIINFTDIVEWIVDGKCTDEVYKLLNKNDFPFYVCDKIYNGEKENFTFDFADWIDSQVGIVKFIESDWNELINNFNK